MDDNSKCRLKRFLIIGIACCLAACAPAPIDYGTVFSSTAGRWVDLTHAFDDSTIYWPTDTAGFQLRQLALGPTPGGWFYASYEFTTAEHGGTHLDAPIHFAEGGLTNDRIPLSGLIGPAAIIDVSDVATADYLVGVEDLTTWEAEHGEIPARAILLIRTGWGSRWNDRTGYIGTDLIGPEAVAELHFPSVSPEAAEWLVANRGIVALGIDTPSIDYGQSEDFRTHIVLFAENISGFENVANLDLLPETGSYVVALPMKIAGGSGGPLRIVAFVPSEAGR